MSGVPSVTLALTPTLSQSDAINHWLAFAPFVSYTVCFNHSVNQVVNWTLPNFSEAPHYKNVRSSLYPIPNNPNSNRRPIRRNQPLVSLIVPLSRTVCFNHSVNEAVNWTLLLCLPHPTTLLRQERQARIDTQPHVMWRRCVSDQTVLGTTVAPQRKMFRLKSSTNPFENITDLFDIAKSL